MPLVIAITGKSDAGKTSLIKGLIPEMKKRGYKVAAVKNCPHGFDLDVEGKDSWHFTKAGAGGILLQSPSELGLIRTKGNIIGSLNEVAKYYLADFDLVLAEGFAQDTSTRRIEVLRKGMSPELESPRERLVAIVTDFAFPIDKPTFNPTELSELADFIEKVMKEDKESKPYVELSINKKPVYLNEFAQSMIKGTITGLVASLKREDKELREIEIRIRPSEEVKKDE